MLPLDQFGPELGITLDGVSEGGAAGISVSTAGDFNGDGIDDLLVGALGESTGEQSNVGAVYVVFGSSTFPSEFRLGDLDGENGFVVRGMQELDSLGENLASLGDLNGDGFDDIGLGAVFGDGPVRRDVGTVYVIYGGENVAPGGEFDLSSLDGVNGFFTFGFFDGGRAMRVSSAGDLNADGYLDIAIGSELADPGFVDNPGQLHVIYGGPELGSTGSIALRTLTPETGFTLNGVEVDTQTGRDTAEAFDVNGDGIDDLLFGASSLSADGSEIGREGGAYVLFGSPGLSPPRDLLGQLDGENGFLLECVGSNYRCGVSVGSLGDMNNDGYNDFVVSGSEARPTGELSVGESYIVFGGPDVGGSGVVRTSELDGSNGITIEGRNENDRLGRESNPAGDINGDGIPDAVVGAAGAELESDGEFDDRGEVYVLYGHADLGSVPRIHVDDLDGENGFAIQGRLIDGRGDLIGIGVRGVGDFNADGIDDLAVGASNAQPDGLFAQGKVFLLFGRDEDLDTDNDGVADSVDNCIQRANADQRDSNADGYGNVCDADLDDSCLVNRQDWFIMREAFGSNDQNADLDGDGVVTIGDALVLLGDRAMPPGPSGLTDVCQR
ncbi:MAG: integrin alpha [Pseudomonadota bacterium]